MTRKKLSTPMEITTADEANAALREIGTLTIKLEAIDAKADQEIGKVKEKAALLGEEHRERITDLEDALSLFCKVNKHKLFNERKSIPLSYGIIGFRQSTSVKTKRTTLELVKKLFPDRIKTAIRVKEEVNKEDLKEWADEELAQVDAAKVPEDKPFYEVNREEVNKNLLKAG